MQSYGMPGYGGVPQTGGGGGNGSVTDKLSGFFGNEQSLPMYKDKPYFSPRRTGPNRNRGKVGAFGAFCLFVVFVMWYCGGGSGTLNKIGHVVTPDVAKGVDLWSWSQSFGASPSSENVKSGKGGKVKSIDWAARREKVKDAFIVSWDGYEKYAWGALALICFVWSKKKY